MQYRKFNGECYIRTNVGEIVLQSAETVVGRMIDPITGIEIWDLK